MKPSDGPRERVRCKVGYIVKNEGQSVKMSVRCASDAYKMELSANTDQKGSELTNEALYIHHFCRVGSKLDPTLIVASQLEMWP
jgi:hypothetical protein